MVWHYIHVERIPVVPLYFARAREVLVRNGTLLPLEHDPPRLIGEKPQTVVCRMRSLGCTYCTGAVRSDADSVPKIIEELLAARRSERENRGHRLRPGRVDGVEETRGLLLMAPATETAAPPLTIEEYLARCAEQDLVRLTTAGSVDDGKSTLIGRLLYDAKAMFEDQFGAIRASKVNRTGGPLDFSLLTDGLRAEREQGITIDVAYRHFSTPRRKFIIADTPGHEQYTRNMATGASTADVAVILVDARNGVLPQSRRHACIANLLGIPHLAVAVNKMDLVGWREEVFRAHTRGVHGVSAAHRCAGGHFIPVSALDGDNVANPSHACPWYEGGTLIEYLETVPVAVGLQPGEFRFPVQWVNRPDLSFRGFAGQIASGEVRRGDLVMALPSGKTSRVKSIVTYDGELETAHAPMSVTVCLEDELDIGRGDMLAAPASLPHVSRQFEAEVVWMAAEPLRRDAPYLVKHTTQQARAKVVRVVHRLNVNTLAREEADELGLNEIGTVAIETSSPLFFDSYRRNRADRGLYSDRPRHQRDGGSGHDSGAPPFRSGRERRQNGAAPGG